MSTFVFCVNQPNQLVIIEIVCCGVGEVIKQNSLLSLLSVPFWSKCFSFYLGFFSFECNCRDNNSLHYHKKEELHAVNAGSNEQM